MTATNVTALIPNRPDAEVAAEHKEKISAKLIELCKLMDEAKGAGFVTQLNLGLDWAGRWVIAGLTLQKHF